MTVTTTDLVPAPTPEESTFGLDQRRATAYAGSGYWPDAKSVAQALVKIEAGRALNLPPLIAMSEVHVIEGKPSLGAGAYAALVKAHPRYDYRIRVLTDQECEIAFYEGREHVGSSTFTIKDAERAKLLNKGPWAQYPRNMLFARAMSNGCAWFAPDVTMGRVYTGDEIDANAPPPPLPEEVAGLDEPIDGEDIPWPDSPHEHGFGPPKDPAAEDQPPP